jgi:hypothetical protein
VKKYIDRGCEDAVTKALNEYGLACILGIPGVGKTTTARYIASKSRERRFVPIILTSGGADITLKDRLIEFADERGDKHTVLQIPIDAYNTIDNDLAKSIAEAIAKVVNATLEDKILENVSRITEKSDLVKKFADVVKGVGKKLDIPREIVENAKSTLKGVSNFVDIEEFAKYGAEFCSCFLLGVDIVKLAEKLKGKGGVLKLKKKIVVIIDDLADFKFGDGAALLRLEDWLIKNGAKVLLIRRINLEEEFMGISKETNDSYVRYTNKIIAGSRDVRVFEDKRQVLFMPTPDFDTFKEIIEANVEERLKPEDIGSLFQVSGGLPTLAILMQDIGVKYGEETEIDIYSSLEEAKTDVEKARATLSVIRNGIRSVYEEAKRLNLALLALFVQPTACEELETLCKSSEIEKVFGRLNCSQNLDSYKRIVEIREELWVDDRMRKFYELNDNWKHMILFLDVLCDTEEGVKQEVKTVRNVLLDIMGEDQERVGWINSRTLLAGLDNLKWLKEKADEKHIRHALNWGRTALEYTPELGFEFFPQIFELADNIGGYEPLASTYAAQLVERSGIMNFSLDDINAIIEKAERLINNPSEDPDVQAHRAEAFSAIAKTLRIYGLERTSFSYMERAEQIVESINDKNVRNLAKIAVWLDKVTLYGLSNPNEGWHWAEVVSLLIEKVRESLVDYASNRFVVDYFKPYGGDIEGQLKNHLDRWFYYAKYLISEIFVTFNWLDEAETAFTETLEYSKKMKKLDGIHSSQDHIARIKAIRDFQFENFEDLYKQVKDYEVALYPVQITSTYAEYWLACMLSGKEIKEDEKREIEEYTKKNLGVYTLLLGVGYMLTRKFAKKVILEALEALEKERSGASTTVLAKILRLLIENERERAFEVANDAFFGFIQIPLLSRLYSELADSIQREDKKKTNEALVKLFYWHI